MVPLEKPKNVFKYCIGFPTRKNAQKDLSKEEEQQGRSGVIENESTPSDTADWSETMQQHKSFLDGSSLLDGTLIGLSI